MTALKSRLRAAILRAWAALWNPRGVITTGAVVSIFFILALMADQGTHRPTEADAVPVERTITQLLDDASRGYLSGARIDENRLIVRAEYARSPGDGDAKHRSPKAGEAVEVPVVTGALPQIVAEMVKADVPLRATSTLVQYQDPQSGATTTVKPAPVQAADTRRSVYRVGLFLSMLTLFGGVLWFFHRRLNEPVAATATAAEPADDGSRPAAAGGKDKSEVEPATVPDTRFSDVAGCQEAISELSELVMFLRDPDRFTRLGAKAPKGALLTGPPGTGKTLLARAVAGEAGVPMFTAAGSDFVEMYVGVGAKRVRALFAAARKHERAIIFIDEIDAVARKRSGSGEAGAAESESTLIALLAEMDGFTASNVIVIAATNRADILDEAIKRPGRLDRKIEVPNPDRRGRQEILAVHTKDKPLAGDVDLVHLARRTPGFSGAQLAALVNEACLEAVRTDSEEVTAEHFDDAVATVAMGRARTSALVTEYDRQVTAWHEAGHTLAAYLQADADDPVQVTIVPRGPAGGVTWMSGNDDIFLSRRKAHARLVTALAGRAAEEVLMGGEFTQGASGDLQSATQTALAMATQYGMTRLGYQVRGQGSESNAQVQEVVEELLAEAHVRATELLGQHRAFLEAVATTLLEEETLTLAQVQQIGDRLGVPRHADVPVPALPAAVRPIPSRTNQGQDGAAQGAPPMPRQLVPSAAARTRRVRGPVAVLAALRARRAAPTPQPPVPATH